MRTVIGALSVIAVRVAVVFSTRISVSVILLMGRAGTGIEALGGIFTSATIE